MPHDQRHAGTAPRPPIAIVGMGCRFPGGVASPKAFWDLIAHGRDAIVEVPPERWNLDRFFDADPDKPGKMYIRAGGFLHQPLDRFDAQFFGIAPREATCLDPQQRLLLEVAWESLEDAGIVVAGLAGSATGVFIGGFTLDNMLNQMSGKNRERIGAHTAVGSTMTILSNRLSYAFDLRGPSVSMDTACSSSLVALHYACQSLWHGECTMALAGGVNVMISPEYPIAMCKGRFLATDGHCKTFDERADGYGRGEGAGIIVLKPLADAQRDGNHIYALVRGTGVNQDGRTNGITVPNPESQQALITRVCSDAQINPQHISYIEAHGTGTKIGDGLEATALGQAIGRGRQAGQECLVGSVKANIGHLEAASGIAGTIKVALCLQERQIPPLANLETPNPKIPFAELGLRLPTSLQPLPAAPGQALIGLNSFGYGGTNAHALFAEAPPVTNPIEKTAAANNVSGPSVLPISARSDAALKALASAYSELLAQGTDFTAVCAAASLCRDHHARRVVVTATNAQEARNQLASFVATGRGEHLATGMVLDDSAALKPVFVFTGMGPQWWAMGRELLETDALVRATAETCDAIFQRYAGWSILTEMLAPEASSRMSETQIAQPANFILQVALAARWQAWGIEPAAVVGHSVGEVSSSYFAGALSLEDAVRVSYERSRIQQKAAGQGRMLAVGLSEAQCAELLVGLEGRVSIAAINSRSGITLAGETAALQDLAAQLEARNVFNRLLQVEVAYHSPMMDPLREEVLASLAGLRPQPPTLPLYSTVTGQRVDEAVHGAEYWWRNVRQSVLFGAAMDALVDAGHRLFLEIGPHPVLSTSIKECLAGHQQDGICIASLRRKQPEALALHEALAALHCAGVRVDWSRRYAKPATKIALPTYPWQREIYWNESPEAAAERLGRPEHALLGQVLSAPQPTWEAPINHHFLPFLDDHQIQGLVVLPGAAYIEAGLAMARTLGAEHGARLDDLVFHQALVVDAGDEPVLRCSYDSTLKTFAVHSRTRDDKQRWVQHATGHIVPAAPVELAPIDLHTISVRCTTVVDKQELYRRLSARGLEYGPWFQGVDEARCGSGEILARISRTAGNPCADDRFLLHPVLLDACFQALILAVDDGQQQRLYIPVRIASLHWYRTPGDTLWVHGHLTKATDTAIEGSLTLCDEQGAILAEVHGLRCQSLSQSKHDLEQLERWTYQYAWQNAPALAAKPAGPELGRWLILLDQHGIGASLDALLASISPSSVVRCAVGTAFARQAPDTFIIRAGAASDIAELLDAIDTPTLRGIICLWGVDAGSDGDVLGRRALDGALHLIQALERHAAQTRLVFVTRGAQVVDPQDAPVALAPAGLVGLARVARNEHPALCCTLVDLDAADHNPAPALLAEILEDDGQDDIAWRGGQRKLHRLERIPFSALDGSDAPQEVANAQAFMLENTSGSAFRFRACGREAPAAGMVEIELHAVALNAALNATHDEQADSVRRVTAGVVSAIGPGVTTPPVGTTVLAMMPGTLRSHACIPATAVIALQQDAQWGHSEAAGQVMPLATAWHALRQVAQVQAGETLVVGAPASRQGRSVIAVARLLGARVFATVADAAEMRALVAILPITQQIDLRRPGALETFRRATSGALARVVINAGENDQLRRLSALLAPAGTLIQLAHPASTDGELLALRIGRNQQLATVDLEMLWERQPDQLTHLVDETWSALRSGRLSRLPTAQFPAAQLADAVATLDTEREPVVIQLRGQPAPALLPPQALAVTIRADATYLITGGFGGFGMELARWLVAAGARHLALIGRRGAAGETAQALVAELRRGGAQVMIGALDISQADEVARLFAELNATMPPLRGVIHTAAVLDDAPLMELDAERFTRVLAPKALGAWNLHLHTQALSMDFFLLCSSVSALIGNSRQGNYVAANVFLDHLAHHRRALGLPATSVNWGALSLGMAADETVMRHLQLMGISPLSRSQSTAVIAKVLQWNQAQLGIMDVDWQAWARYEPNGGKSPRFAHLVGAKNADEAQSPSAQLRRTLLAIPTAEHKEMITLLLLEHVAGTLRMPTERLDPRVALSSLGIDSLMAMELQAKISRHYAVELSTLELMKGASVAQLAERIHAKMALDETVAEHEAPVPLAPPAASADASAADVSARLSDMPESAVDHLLLQLLAPKTETAPL